MNRWFAPLHYARAYRDPLAFLLNSARNFPDIAALQIGNRKDYVVFDPELVREVLLAKEDVLDRGFNSVLRKVMGNGLLSVQGQMHRDLRRTLLPLFDRNRLRMYSETMVEQTRLLDTRWSDGETVDIADEMLQLSFDIIVEVVFGARSKTSSELARLFRNVIENTGGSGHLRRLLGNKMRFLRDRNLEETIEQLDEVIYRLIDEYRSDKNSKPCFLSMLLEFQHPTETSKDAIEKWARDESVTMLIAGHETVATQLAWTWYLLARNPEDDARLQDELCTVLDGRSPTFDDIPRLTFTTAVLLESMRIYPPIWVMVRRPIEDWQACGQTFPAKSYIYISPYAIHRDSRWFDDPDRFDPTRWTDRDKMQSRHKFAYIPFGSGGRKCIGETFAMVEATLAVAMLAQKWRMELVDGQSIEPDPLVSLRPKDGIKMKLIRRTP